MGEAKRRRRAAGRQARQAAREPHQHRTGCRWDCVDADGRYLSGLTFAEIEQLAAEDPGDREDREAHGIPYEADHRDPEEKCRNGCGLSYMDVVAGKIRVCRGEP